MGEGVAERLALIISKLNTNKNQLANALNFKNSVVGNIVNKRNLPSYDFIARLKSYEKRIDLNWFFTGEGEMFLAENSENMEIYKELAASLRRENELLREKIAQSGQSNDGKNKKVS